MKKIFLIILLCGLSCAVSKSQISFALLTDTHVKPGTKTEDALIQIVEEINQSPLDFVIASGDMSGEGTDEQLHCVHTILEKINKPYFIVPGNHETIWSQSACKTFLDLWKDDRFFFRHKNNLFIGVNSGPYMEMGMGHVKREDILWLDKTLKEKTVEKDHIFVVIHMPLTDVLGNWKEVVEVLAKYPVALVLCGHGHKLQKMTFGTLPGIMGRSTYIKGNSDAGYNLVTLTEDSILFYEKYVGGDKEKRISLVIGERKKTEIETRPEFEYKLPDDVKLSLFYRDDASLFTGIASDDKHIYFGNSLGEIKAINISNKEIAWRFNTNISVYSTPLCYKNKVIVPSANGYIYALDAHNGKVSWTINGENPFVADGHIYDKYLYQGGFKKFYKIDTENGKILWTFDKIENYCQASPVFYKEKVIFGAWDTNLYCLNQKSGDEIWKWNNGNSKTLYSPGNCVPVVAHNKVFLVAPDKYTTALNVENGTVVWRENKDDVRESMGLSEDNDRVYIKKLNGDIVALSAKGEQYKPLWTVPVQKGMESASCPIVERNGIIYAGSYNGLITAIEATTCKIIWQYKCGTSAINRFHFDKKGNLYFTLIEGKVYKLDLK